MLKDLPIGARLPVDSGIVTLRCVTLRHVWCTYFNMEKRNLKATLSFPYSCIYRRSRLMH